MDCCCQGLKLLMKLLIPPGSDDLDPTFCAPGPNNALYPLWRHLSHKDNAELIPLIEAAAAAEGKGCRRLLRLLCPALFPQDRYHQWRRIARGASAEVSAFACCKKSNDAHACKLHNENMQ